MFVIHFLKEWRKIEGRKRRRKWYRMAGSRPENRDVYHASLTGARAWIESDLETSCSADKILVPPLIVHPTLKWSKRNWMRSAGEIDRKTWRGNEWKLLNKEWNFKFFLFLDIQVLSSRRNSKPFNYEISRLLEFSNFSDVSWFSNSQISKFFSTSNSLVLPPDILAY